MGPFDTLLVRAERGVLHLTLHQPASRNAMSLRMVAELRAALAAAEASTGAERVRVVVLRGAGGTFCSGGDLKDMAAARLAPPAGGEDPLCAVSRAFGELCAAFARTPLATVAVLEGAVLGGGFGLACAVDVALASDSVKLRLPEVERGLVPAQIAPFLVERLGISQARRLAITAATVEAAEALRLGLVHEVAPAAELDAALARVLTALLGAAPDAIAATKALMAEGRLRPASELVARAAEVFAAAARGAEGAEGMTAFLQKRKPAWAHTAEPPTG